MNAMIRRVLVTGGAGYLGGRLVEHLHRRGAEEIRVGSRKTGFDLFSAESLDRHCAGMSAVVHLAAPNEMASLAHPDEAVRVTVLGTLNLLAATRKAGISRFVFVSTAHVYGAPLAGLITERTVPRPVHPYAIAHRSAEDFVLAWNDERKVEGVVARLSNALGPPVIPDVDRWTLVTNDLCRQAVLQKRMVLKSAGLQWRDFIAMCDVCRAVAHLLALPTVGDGLFNLGGGECLQIRTLAERIAGRCAVLYGAQPEIVCPAPTAADNPPALDFRSEKLQGTGFMLQGRIDDEIDATLRFCQTHFV